jgi:hypothetical protein
MFVCFNSVFVSFYVEVEALTEKATKVKGGAVEPWMGGWFV